jgi:mannose-6-phosphate isomerase-like protein (cupin superfamily)
VEEFRKWTSNEVAHNLPARNQRSILPALYELTPCSKHPIRHAYSVSVSRSSRALGQHGTPHPLGQTLITTSGCGWVQSEGGRKQEIGPGDVVWCPPGEKHWHGATTATAMTHIAIVEQLDGKAVDWMEKVTDEQYDTAVQN